VNRGGPEAGRVSEGFPRFLAYLPPRPSHEDHAPGARAGGGEGAGHCLGFRCPGPPEAGPMSAGPRLYGVLPGHRASWDAYSKVRNLSPEEAAALCRENGVEPPGPGDHCRSFRAKGPRGAVKVIQRRIGPAFLPDGAPSSHRGR
jgi:hypothetical protein